MHVPPPQLHGKFWVVRIESNYTHLSVLSFMVGDGAPEGVFLLLVSF